MSILSLNHDDITQSNEIKSYFVEENSCRKVFSEIFHHLMPFVHLKHQQDI
ncbi:hypothetical protein MTBBW1_1050005 [Desulfamplus magnetovallimortis]|uniref:Uncharacterized protein n=1 Tax=Desulfamplus magnetovallimortis TaxID=1246637 RepID=A0A1W1H576_9BACT|nr:hypothetical protein MTBBW1_1050005 [Desulfamplus magnetovallimortis]